MGLAGKKVVVVMPAYNAAKTLKKTYDEVPKDVVDEILLVDDGSHDETIRLSKELGIKTFIHERNFGYGLSGYRQHKFSHSLFFHPIYYQNGQE